MTAYYRNRETGLIQSHPVSGLGEAFNSDEVGEDAKPILPLGTDPSKAVKLAGGRKPRKPRAAAKPAEDVPPTEDQTTEATTGDGDSNEQEGTK